MIYNRQLTQSSGCTITFIEDKTGLNMVATIKRGKNRNMSIRMQGEELFKKLASLDQPYCVFTPGLSGITLYEEFRTKAIVNKSATRGDSNLFLRNILYILHNDTVAWADFETSMKIFFPNYSLTVSFESNEDDYIPVEIKQGDVTLPIDAFGTSALQIIQILSYIYCFKPKLLILDEPDTHLHPNNQRKLVRELEKIAKQKDLQIILSTHSRHIIDEIKDSGKVFWINEGSIQNDTDIEYTQLLMELGALDKNDLLNNPRIKTIVCTEDELKSEMLSCVLQSSGFDMDTISIIPYCGCSKFENARLLSAFIARYCPNKMMIIHRDRDYVDDIDTNDFVNKLTTDNTKVFITPNTDVEAIFLNAEHINHVYSQISIDEANKIINEAIDESCEISIEKFTNSVFNTTKERNAYKINKNCREKYMKFPKCVIHMEKKH